METTESPTEAPTDERKLHISIILYLLDITLTYHLTYYTILCINIIISHIATHQPTDEPSSPPSLSPTHQPSSLSVCGATNLTALSYQAVPGVCNQDNSYESCPDGIEPAKTYFGNCFSFSDPQFTISGIRFWVDDAVTSLDVRVWDWDGTPVEFEITPPLTVLYSQRVTPVSAGVNTVCLDTPQVISNYTACVGIFSGVDNTAYNASMESSTGFAFGGNEAGETICGEVPPFPSDTFCIEALVSGDGSQVLVSGDESQVTEASFAGTSVASTGRWPYF